MATLPNGASGKGNSGKQNHDGQKNYQHSNQRNPDNIRNNTRDHEYKEYDETLTNDENFDASTGKPKKGDMEFDDKKQNVEED